MSELGFRRTHWNGSAVVGTRNRRTRVVVPKKVSGDSRVAQHCRASLLGMTPDRRPGAWWRSTLLILLKGLHFVSFFLETSFLIHLSIKVQ